MSPQPASTVAESRIAAWGIDGGLRGLVNRWRGRAARISGVTLTWEYHEGGIFPARHQAPADHGIFVLDPIGTHDDWVLKFEWREWGWRALEQGRERELKAKALQILRSGGPFGGPGDIFPRRSPTKPWPPSGMVRHAAPAGELRVGELVPGVGALLHVALDGTFAQQVLDAQGLAHDPADLVGKLGPVEALVLAGERVPWIFTDVWPLLGRIQVSAFDLLSCWLTRDEVAIIAARDEPYGVFVGTWAEVRALERRSLAGGFADAADRPSCPAAIVHGVTGAAAIAAEPTTAPSSTRVTTEPPALSGSPTTISRCRAGATHVTTEPPGVGDEPAADLPLPLRASSRSRR